jgi:hypothetical protein
MPTAQEHLPIILNENIPIEERIAIYTQKAIAGEELSKEEMKIAINYLRGTRISGIMASRSKKKAEPAVNTSALLEGFKNGLI